MATKNKEQTARKFGVDIANAESQKTLERLIEDLTEAHNMGHINSGDFDQLKHYADHRWIVLKHNKPTVAEILNKDIDEIDNFDNLKERISLLHTHLQVGRITDGDFTVLHSKACRKMEEFKIKDMEVV